MQEHEEFTKESSNKSNESNESKELVEITLLITGGHKQVIHLIEESPLLSALIGSIVNSNQARGDGAIFNIPLSNQEGALLVRGDQICGLLINRPLLLEIPPVEQAASSTAQFKNVKWCIAEDFLEQADVDQLLQFVALSEPRFVSSMTSSGDPHDRKSLFLPDFYHPLKSVIEAKVISLAEEKSEQLLGRRLKVRSVTSQLTAHKNGDYFRTHLVKKRPSRTSYQLRLLFFSSAKAVRRRRTPAIRHDLRRPRRAKWPNGIRVPASAEFFDSVSK